MSRMTLELLTALLDFHPPLDWDLILGYFRARAMPGVEVVTDDGYYHRSVRIHWYQGSIVVGRAPDLPNSLRLRVSPGLAPALPTLTCRLRRALDLDQDPVRINSHLGQDRFIASLVERRPGLRVPGSVDGFELAVRAVLGQQITVRGASTLAGRLVRLAGEELQSKTVEGGRRQSKRDPPSAPEPLTHLPLTPERLADTPRRSLLAIGLTRARADCLLGMSRVAADGKLPELTGDTSSIDPAGFIERFTELAGIGAWTAEYVAMRALGWKDAFPAGDLGLRKAMGGLSTACLRAAAEPWRPWRAYAAQHLWASLRDPVAGTTPASPRVASRRRPSVA